MTDTMTFAAETYPPLPPDDTSRQLTVARPDGDDSLPHVCVVGDTYTMLVLGKDTAGRFALIDMHIPPGGGPPPHRHDFEETFHVLEGEIEVTFRGSKSIARVGETVNVPANAPHQFRNASAAPVRLLCLVAPAGQEEFFLAVGQPVPTRTSPPPPLDDASRAELMRRMKTLMPKYRNEAVQA